MLFRDRLSQLLAKASFHTLVLRAASSALMLCMQLVLARSLGATEYGIYVYATSWLVVLAIVSRLGMNTGLTRLVAEYNATGDHGCLRGALRWSIRNSIGVSLVTAVVASSLVFLARDSMPRNQPLTLWIALATLPFLSLTMLRQGALRGLRRVVQADFPELIVRPALVIVVVVSSVALGATLEAHHAATASLFAYLIAFLLGTYWLRAALPPNIQNIRPIVNSRAWWHISLPLVFMQSMHTILGRMDVLMLANMSGAEAAGIYGATVSVAGVVVFGLNVVNPMISPMIAELFVANRKQELQGIVTLGARICTAITLVAAVCLAFLGKPILALFGPEFAPGYTALMILVAGQLVNSLCGSVGLLMTMTGNQTMAAMILGATAILNAALNLLLIPLYGLEGAATATAVSIAAWNIAMLLYSRAKIGIRSTAF